MTDRDFYGIMFCMGALAGIAILHGRLIAVLSERTLQVSADVEFLKDHTVARESEPRP
jgi:hypothetical protein